MPSERRKPDLARTQQTDPASRPVAPSADNPGRRPTPGAAPGAPTGTYKLPEPERPECALFQVFLATGSDAATAYTAIREMESTAGHNVVVQLGAQIQTLATQIQTLASQIQALGTALDRVENSLETVKTEVQTVKTEVQTVKTEVAVLKREVRLIWLLLIPTFAAILVRLFTL